MLSVRLGLLKNKVMVRELVLAILLFVLISSCNQDDNIIPDGYTGTLTALRDGKELTNPIKISDNRVNPSDSMILALTASFYDSAQVLIESLAITSIKPIFEQQSLNMGYFACRCTYVRFTTVIDGHIPGDRYEIDTTIVNNFIRITNYNSAKAEIEGIFNISLILTRDSNEPGNPPQTIEFTDGKFTSKVQREWFE